MRVTQIADLAGTTPRAVRHYHRLGLLSVPPTVRGGREYGVEHLARLLRIRWLADGTDPLMQPLGVVKPVDTENDCLRVAQILAKLGGLSLDLLRGGQFVEST